MATKKARKVLPDLREVGYTFPEAADSQGRRPSPPAAENIRELAMKHNFAEHFDLVSELNECWFWWRAGAHFGPAVPGSVRRDFLIELARRAEDLAEAVTKAGSYERRLILDIETPDRLDLEAVEKYAQRLSAAAAVAARNVPRSAPGARGDPDTIDLLCKLWRVYLKAFGPNARRLTRSGDKYSGRFFYFADDVLRLFNICKSNMALGKAIEKAQTAVDARSSVPTMP